MEAQKRKNDRGNQKYVFRANVEADKDFSRCFVDCYTICRLSKAICQWAFINRLPCPAALPSAHASRRLHESLSLMQRA
jgi:hypothetical protein